MGREYAPDDARAFTRITKTDTCWLWTGYTNSCGYGLIKTRGDNQRARVVHRVIYESLIGPLPEGMVLDHLCRVRRCVNPDHMEVVSPEENNRRGRAAAADESIRGDAYLWAIGELDADTAMRAIAKTLGLPVSEAVATPKDALPADRLEKP